jgi:hypothetical protein
MDKTDCVMVGEKMDANDDDGHGEINDMLMSVGCSMWDEKGDAWDERVSQSVSKSLLKVLSFRAYIT